MIELWAVGKIPSKKNLLKMTRGGRCYYDAETKSRLNDLSDQLSEQWGYRRPLIHPAIAMAFYVTSALNDKDNKYTTMLDAMVSAGILEDDSIAKCNGYALILKALTTKSYSGARIFIQEDGDLDSLVEYVKAQDLGDCGWMKVEKDKPRRCFRMIGE
jgi:hypothetical protein